MTRPRIEASALVEMFDNIRKQTDWNLAGPMRWGYFFTDPDPEKLEQAGEALAKRGYHVVGLLEPDEEDETQDQEVTFLHVERVETHTPASLHARNQELYAFADEQGLESYDGMDVGPVKA